VAHTMAAALTDAGLTSPIKQARQRERDREAARTPGAFGRDACAMYREALRRWRLRGERSDVKGDTTDCLTPVLRSYYEAYCADYEAAFIMMVDDLTARGDTEGVNRAYESDLAACGDVYDSIVSTHHTLTKNGWLRNDGQPIGDPAPHSGRPVRAA
jgi:hypothetical protein